MKNNLMKLYLLTGALLLFTITFAQRDKNPDELNARTFELKVKTVPGDSLDLPFESIRIIDCRPDTSKLGYRHNDVFGYSKIRLYPTITEGIENFYFEYYRSNFTANGKVLLISIKKLWINNFPDKQKRSGNMDLDEESSQDIHARFEFYYGSGNAYSPLLRTDTVFHLTPKISGEEFDPKEESKLPFLCFALEQLIEKINFPVYLRNVDKKKKMSMEDIEKYNAASFNIPVLNEPIKKGVYVTFEEFKNNQPSILSFRRKKLINNLWEITDDNKNMIFKYFAYFDGTKLAITKHLAGMFDKNVSKDNFMMYRVGNSFQFYQQNNRTYTDNTMVVTDRYSVSIPVTSTMKDLVPRQVDLETGEVY
jgi:hypothetical protein